MYAPSDPPSFFSIPAMIEMHHICTVHIKCMIVPTYQTGLLYCLLMYFTLGCTYYLYFLQKYDCTLRYFCKNRARSFAVCALLYAMCIRVCLIIRLGFPTLQFYLMCWHSQNMFWFSSRIPQNFSEICLFLPIMSIFNLANWVAKSKKINKVQFWRTGNYNLIIRRTLVHYILNIKFVYAMLCMTKSKIYSKKCKKF